MLVQGGEHPAFGLGREGAVFVNGDERTLGYPHLPVSSGHAAELVDRGVLKRRTDGDAHLDRKSTL